MRLASERNPLHDGDYAADALGGVAVHAMADLRAGRMYANARGVGRRRRVARARDGLFEVVSHFVQAHDVQDFARAPCHARDAVAGAVDVDYLSVGRHGVGACDKPVGCVLRDEPFAFIIRRQVRIPVMVDRASLCLQLPDQPQLAHGNRTGDADSASAGYQFHCQLDRSGRVLRVPRGLKALREQPLAKSIAQRFPCRFDRSFQSSHVLSSRLCELE